MSSTAPPLRIPDADPHEFRFRTDLQRNAAATVILAIYGDRDCSKMPPEYYEWLAEVCPECETDPVRRALASWRCAMLAAKFDPHRTADERATCRRNWADYEWEFRSCFDANRDAQLGYILRLEGFPT